MDDEIVISVNHVYKNFVLPHEKISSVKGLFTSLAKRRPSKTKETQRALQDINFQIKKGEFFGIVGRNGSGKSTMLKILAGIYQPTRGSVQTHGKLVPFIELGVGFNAELTGRENVFLNGALLGFSHSEIAAMYDGIVAFAELEKFMDQKLKNYSSGMQVRLAFSMATRADAEILLIDEVLAVGDADFQRKCFDYFRSLKKNKKTVVFVSHDMNAIREYCDRAVMIEANKMVAEGDPELVAMEYNKAFMHEDARNNKDATSKRWGDKTIHYTKVRVEPKVVKAQKTIKIITTAKATVDLDDPVFGFVIKNAAGQHILGTNSKIKHQKFEHVTSGQEFELSWELPHVFGDGKYYMDLAIHRDSGSRDADWWEDAASFTVYKDERTPYIISPDVTLTVKS
ncbi:MAG: tagH [Candidatus Saccharibacteria bacterium]|nr:tagH [Candidatus Saccharibacteria bacterium]